MNKEGSLALDLELDLWKMLFYLVFLGVLSSHTTVVHGLHET